MARYHSIAPEIGKEVNAFCDRHNLTASQRVELLQLMFGSTRIASGGRLQFSTRVESYKLIGREVKGVKARPHKVEKEASADGRYPAKEYDSVRFVIDEEDPCGGMFPTAEKSAVGSNEEESE